MRTPASFYLAHTSAQTNVDNRNYCLYLNSQRNSTEGHTWKRMGSERQIKANSCYNFNWPTNLRHGHPDFHTSSCVSNF